MRLFFSSSRLVLVAVLALGLAAPGQAQTAIPYTVELDEVDRPLWPGLHSFAAAEHGGRWLLVGGRTNGLHGFGSNPFPTESANGDLVVLDPATGDVWTASLDGLDASIADPLRATNAQAHQSGDTLLVVGGYGDSAAAGDKVTFATLTALDVPALMAAVVTGGPLAPHIAQLASDPALAVTGGGLVALDDRYYLAGGNRFDGEYNSPVFQQDYTEAVRSFVLSVEDGQLVPKEFEAVVDAVNLHRRDGNVTPFVFPDGREGFVLYGGVFDRDLLPIRQPVYADGSGLTVDPTFRARFGHYTSPTLPVFDAATGTMHTTFFGGMGQFYLDAAGAPVEDQLVPFVDAVTTISRTAEGASSERVMPFRMPGLLGTNAAFFLAPGVPRTAHGVIRLNALTERTLVGHVFGGIASTAPHPGTYPGTGTTEASRRLFAVYLDPTRPTGTEPTAPVAFVLPAPYPNPFRDETTVSVALDTPQPLRVEVFDGIGRRVAVLHDGPLAAGPHTFAFRPAGLAAGVFHVRVQGLSFNATRSIVLAR